MKYSKKIYYRNNIIYIMKFENIVNNDKIFLYYGDMPKQRRDYTNIPFIGLSLHNQDHDNRVKNPFRPMSIVVDCYK